MAGEVDKDLCDGRLGDLHLMDCFVFSEEQHREAEAGGGGLVGEVV